jgi:hypothetical protein
VEEREPLPVVAEWRLAGDVGRRYGAASGDRNPIHLYPLTARLFGFPRAIAHGMWSVARCLAEHGAPQAVLVRAEFRAPVLLPGTVSYGADGDAFELRGAGARGGGGPSGVRRAGAGAGGSGDGDGDGDGSGNDGGSGSGSDGGRLHLTGQVLLLPLPPPLPLL